MRCTYINYTFLLLVAMFLFTGMSNTGDKNLDPVIVSPEKYTVVAENDHFRMLEIKMKPGEQDKMHEHPHSFIYFITSVKGRVHLPDGSSKEIEVAAGKGKYQEKVEIHRFENIGETEIHVIQVELKGKRFEGPPPEVDPTKVSPEMHQVLVENEFARLIEITLKPGQRDEMHSHPLCAVYVLDDAKGRIHHKDGSQEDREVSAGTGYYQESVELHRIENIGSNDIHLIMVEIKN